jgi:hypothetical protein
VLAHRDILQCRASLSANGVKRKSLELVQPLQQEARALLEERSDAGEEN